MGCGSTSTSSARRVLPPRPSSGVRVASGASPYPDEYVELLIKISAFVVMAKEGVWPAPKPYTVGPFWSFYRGIQIFGVGADVPDFLDIERAAEQFAARTGRGADRAVPFMRVIGSADRYCFGPDGSIFEWIHDHPRDEALAPLEVGFNDLVVRELTRLRENAERYLRGEHVSPD